jgi:hypothetical protein
MSDPCRVYRNIVEHCLRYSGYVIDGTPDPDPVNTFIENEFLHIYGIPDRERDFNNKRILYIITKSLKVAISAAIKNIDTECDIVCITNKVPQASAIVQLQGASASFRLWADYHLIVPKSVYAPTMIILSEPEIAALHEQHYGNMYSIPAIRANDPHCIWIGAKPYQYILAISKLGSYSFLRVTEDTTTKKTVKCNSDIDTCI